MISDTRFFTSVSGAFLASSLHAGKACYFANLETVKKHLKHKPLIYMHSCKPFDVAVRFL
jgi:hypothetical protein